MTRGNGVAQQGTCVSEWRVQGWIQIQYIHWKILQAPSFISNVMHNSLDSTNNIIRNIKSPDILGVYDLCNYILYTNTKTQIFGLIYFAKMYRNLITVINNIYQCSYVVLRLPSVWPLNSANSYISIDWLGCQIRPRSYQFIELKEMFLFFHKMFHSSKGVSICQGNA